MGDGGYRDLKVWQRAIDLLVESYRVRKLLPKSEAYGLVSQIQRASVSVPANIAGGNGRDHMGDYLCHLSIAHGSLKELETHVLIAERLGYLEPSTVQGFSILASEVGRMLGGLRKGLKNR